MSDYKCKKCGHNENNIPAFEKADWVLEGFIAKCHKCNSRVGKYSVSIDDIEKVPHSASSVMMSAMCD